MVQDKELIEIVKKSKPFKDVSKFLNLNYRNKEFHKIKRRIEQLNISIDHFYIKITEKDGKRRI